MSLILLVLLLVTSAPVSAIHSFNEHEWSAKETEVLRGLWLGSLAPLPLDPSNAYADDQRAVSLGKKIFSDTRFSGNNEVSCATCHQPDYDFTDKLPQAHGLAFTRRRSMPLAGMGYSPWLFWDGRKDSLWSQALGPLESPQEHRISRTLAVRLTRENYKVEYEQIFGSLPNILDTQLLLIARPSSDDPAAQAAWETMTPERQQQINRVYANMGKSIGAFVRHILPGKSTFDHYVETLVAGKNAELANILTPDEALGLRLFIGKAKCTNCHNGPLLTNFDFHNVGVPQSEKDGKDGGRAEGILQVQADEFNCLGPYSDASKNDCTELLFMTTDTITAEGKFKTPSLRNVSVRPPYMHGGQFASLREVLHHYATVKTGGEASPELQHQGLSSSELDQLGAFLRTLTGTIVSP